MNSRSTWILVVLAIGLFGYIFFFERHTLDTVQQREEATKLWPTFDPQRVQSMEISRTNQVFLRAEKANDQWRLTAPVYPAQSVRIDGFLEKIGELTRFGSIPPQEIHLQSGGLAAFGLDPPRAAVVLRWETNTTTMRIGARTPPQDQVYVQVMGQPGVQITEASLLEHLPNSSSDWRDPMLFRLSGQPFDRIEVQTGGRGFEMQRDSGTQLWRFLKPFPARADALRVDYLLQQFRTARVTQFVTDDPRADLEPYGLQMPETEFGLWYRTNPVVQIQFGRAPTNDPSQVYTRRLSHSNVVLVSRALVDLLRTSHTAFRDPLLLTFAPAAVDRIDAYASTNFSVQRQGQGWQVLPPWNYTADGSLMQLFLMNLVKLEIQEFTRDAVIDFAPFGLENAARRYVLKAAVTNAGAPPTNRVLFEVSFSTNLTDKVYARRSDEASVYTVRFGDVLLLPQAPYQVRDRRIWNFASSNVVGITIRQKGEMRRLARDPARGWGLGDVQNAALEETLHRLGELEAVLWVDRGEEKLAHLGFPATVFEIGFEIQRPSKREVLSIQFGRRSPRRHPYAAVMLPGDGEKVIFQFPETLYELVLRDLSLPQLSENP